jgi:predicted dehydrogenase
VIGAARIGIVGCGVISRQYAENARAFDSFDVVACADLDPVRSEALAAEHGFVAMAPRALLADAAVRPSRRDRVGPRGGQARVHREATRDDR